MDTAHANIITNRYRRRHAVIDVNDVIVLFTMFFTVCRFYFSMIRLGILKKQSITMTYMYNL